MEGIETNSHSFIVKVWVEDSAKEDATGLWRGSITHVPSGQRCYLNTLDEIQDFIAPYLEGMGVKPGAHWRINRWLERLARRDRP